MNNPDTEILFPMRAIPNLADLRGVGMAEIWYSRVAEQNEENVEKIAFSALDNKIGRVHGLHSRFLPCIKGMHTMCAISH